MYIRPIVRGKVKAPVEFGLKLDISVVNGFVRLEHQSFDDYNESGQLIGFVKKIPAIAFFSNDLENMPFVQ